jgi:hypothetical protein
MIYKTNWTEFKSIVTNKSLLIQMIETSVVYQLSAFDNQLTYLCDIPKATPSSSEQADFETNFKSQANQRISLKIDLPTGAATSLNQSSQLSALQIIDDVPTSQNGAFVKGSPIMGHLDDSSTVVATEDNVASIRITPRRAVHTNLRDSSGNEIGTESNPIYTNGSSELFSPLPSIKLTKTTVVPAGGNTNTQQTITSRTAIKELHLGGRASCEGFLARYSAATTEQIPGGGFNSSLNVSSWTNTSLGSSALLSWSYATDQFVEGTGSAKMTFTQSDANNYPEITYTYSTPKDMSVWKQIYARVRVTVAAGGQQTRTVQVRLTSGTAVRIYSITATTTTAPFTTEQWLTIQSDLNTPSSTTGTGTFDINNVNSISLRLVDGGNKAGSIWWDDVKLLGNFNILEKIYTAVGDTIQLRFDPVIIFEVGEVVYLSLTNNSASSTEFQISTSGVDIT